MNKSIGRGHKSWCQGAGVIKAGARVQVSGCSSIRNDTVIALQKKSVFQTLQLHTLLTGFSK
ncbi:MAG TPA: hypothetical protein QF468_07195 [Nitrospinota bacterium]|nr:hypothetical protein [Nitrospinota bacterium]